MSRRLLNFVGAFVLLIVECISASESPIVVADYGGVSAMPYYRALNLLPRGAGESDILKTMPVPERPRDRYNERDMFPVQSSRLTVGVEQSRAISVPGLTPIFLLGDDAASRAWLTARRDGLRALRAIGLVVQVTRPRDLEELRKLSPGITLVPVSADDLAQRLGIRHYPVLITATGIEQ